jgi:LPS O-antigen subunit length determinant protein (WzzB/FepE family)
MDTEAKNSTLISDGQLNLVILVKMLWGKRRLIIFITSIFIVLGLIVSFASPVKYTASIVFLPQTATTTDFTGMGALAGLAGINLSTLMGDQTEISPDIYPNIIQSYPFINELMHTPFDFEEEGEMSLYEKYADDALTSISTNLIEDTTANQDSNLNIVDPAMNDIMKRVLSNFSLEKMDNGLIKLEGTAEEPLVAAQITQKAMVLLQSMLVTYKTQRQREELAYVESRYKEKQSEYEKAREALHNYQDAYRNRVEERVDFQFQLLSDSYNLSQSIYQSLAQQLEQSKLAVQKEVAVFTVVEPVIVPVGRSSPVRTKIMIVFILFGSFAGLMAALGQIFWKYRSDIL